MTQTVSCGRRRMLSADVLISRPPMGFWGADASRIGVPRRDEPSLQDFLNIQSSGGDLTTSAAVS